MVVTKLKKILKKDVFIYCIAFLIPVLVLLTAMWLRDIFPMGEKSVLVWDLEIQYIDLFAWFRNALHSGEGLFYSFSKSLGGNMFGLFSLYLTSPLNLLIYFFDVEDIPAFFSVMTILKIGLAGLTMSIFVTKRFDINNKIFILICSGAYALFEYNIAFSSNIHFLDSVYMLPLAALGVWKLVNGKKNTLLYITTAYVIICNWYIGYMVCLFTVFDFIFEYYLSCQGKTFKMFICSGIRYVGTMILGVFTSAVFFVPAVLAAMNGKGTLSFDKLIPDFHVDPLYPLRALFITSPTNSEHGLPAIYVTYLIVLFCVMLIINRKINKRVKRAVLSFLFFVFISFSFVPLEIIWTDFKETFSFHHRYAFVFGFLMVMAVAFFVKEIEKDRRIFSVKDLAISGAVLVLYFCVQDLVSDLGTKKQMLLTAGIIVVYVFLTGTALLFYKRKKIRLVAGCMILLLFVSEQIYNVRNDFGKYHITLAEYREYAEGMGEAVAEIETGEESVFYRTEKTFSEMSNRRDDREPAASEGFVYGYRGITHYSSTYDTEVNDFLVQLGYCKQDAMASNYVDTNFLADSLLGIRYIMSEEEQDTLETVSSFPGQEKAHIYINEYALDFGTVCRGDATDFTWGTNPFENAEKILNALLGEENKYYMELSSRLTDDEEVSWNIEVEKEGPVYAYFNNGHADADVYVNGKFKQTYFGRFYKNVMYLGTYEAGDIINLKLKDTYDRDYDFRLIAVSLDEELAKEKLSQAKETGFDPDIVKGGYVKGEYETNEDTTMLLQVPYDEGWNVTVNGDKVQYERTFNGLMQIEVPEGNSEIEMKYFPPGLSLGIGCTIIGIGLFFGWSFAECKKRRT